MDPYKYVHVLYNKILFKLENYLDHINTFLDFEESDFISNKNIATIYNSKKFGLLFNKPKCINDLMCGLLGEITEKYISCYYPIIINGKVYESLEFYEFRDDITGKKINYECLNPFQYNYHPGSIGIDKVLIFKCILEEFIKFYKYQNEKNQKISKDSYYLEQRKCEYNKYKPGDKNNYTDYDSYKNIDKNPYDKYRPKMQNNMYDCDIKIQHKKVKKIIIDSDSSSTNSDNSTDYIYHKKKHNDGYVYKKYTIENRWKR
jgi:hypothetical protein